MRNQNAQCQQAFRESLRTLVWLAEVEKVVEIKRDVALAVGVDRGP
jgi:hypothetical protein